MNADSLMDKYGLQQGWNDETKLGICLSYINAQQSDDAFEDHLREYVATETEDTTLVKDSYEDGKCPDCAKPIPDDTTDGEECTNCGHVFYVEGNCDDEHWNFSENECLCGTKWRSFMHNCPNSSNYQEVHGCPVCDDNCGQCKE